MALQHVRLVTGRGETGFGPVIVTRHPSSVLRMREKEERRAALDELVADLKLAANLLEP